MVSRVLAVQMNKICNRSIESDPTGHTKLKTKRLEKRGRRLHFVPDLEPRAAPRMGACLITHQGRSVGRNGQLRVGPRARTIE